MVVKEEMVEMDTGVMVWGGYCKVFSLDSVVGCHGVEIVDCDFAFEGVANGIDNFLVRPCVDLC